MKKTRKKTRFIKEEKKQRLVKTLKRRKAGSE